MKGFWFEYFTAILFCLLAVLVYGVVMCYQAYPYTKVFIGEDSGLLTYGIQAGVEFMPGISYYGEVESWFKTSREGFRSWQLQKTEFTLELSYDNVSVVHKCQHYFNAMDDWDSQNYINYRINLDGNTARRK